MDASKRNRAAQYAPLTAERLRELLRYDPETGSFVRLVTRGGSRSGATVGCLNALGYSVIMVDYRLYTAHRLAWLYMTGEWPPHEIDHADMDRANNRWSNLRSATKSENMSNIGIPASNTSGLKGVVKSGNRWVAQIKKNKKLHYLGSHGSPEEASRAYLAAAAELHGEFAREK